MRAMPLVLALAALLITGCGGGDSRPPASGAKDGRPHILLISIDTLRADHLGSYGYHRDTTPFLDELAGRGIRYANAFVNTHGTPPSHATLFSSLYQETHGVNQKIPVPDAAPMLTEILAESGYRTIAVTGGGFMSRNFGFDRGFETFEVRASPLAKAGGKWIDLVLENLDGDQPLFSFFHTYEVHSPYLPPPEYHDLFGEFSSDIEPTNEVLLPIKDDAADHLDQDDVDYLVAMYDRGIRYADDALKEMFERLDDVGFFENGVVVLTSDHGEEFLEHGKLLHGISLYEELIHVPLIVVGRNVPAGQVEDDLVSLVDIAPTLLALAGLEAPEIMAGRDLFAPHAEELTSQAVFSQYRHLLYTIRTPRWKLIWDTKKPGIELYDLDEDPGELNDLSKVEIELRRKLLRRLRTWRRDLPKLEVAPQDVEIDPEQAKRLEALGYIG